MSPLSTDPEEWIRQAENDLKVAESNHFSGFHVHAAFFCHLSVEKALKGLYFRLQKKIPPKTHNLGLLLSEIDLDFPEALEKQIITLSQANLVSRYPEEQDFAENIYTQSKVSSIIGFCKDTIQWIKNKF